MGPPAKTNVAEGATLTGALLRHPLIGRGTYFLKKTRNAVEKLILGIAGGNPGYPMVESYQSAGVADIMGTAYSTISVGPQLPEIDPSRAGFDCVMAESFDGSFLPDYGNPPVVETVLGVQFERLSGLTNAHLGAFWRTLEPGQWPAVNDAPLLAAQFERFDTKARWAKGVHVQLSQDPASRLQIKNPDGDRMIQVQNSRLHFNWLKKEGEEYPRYDRVREQFVATLTQFTRFVAHENLGEIRPNQWEVTYVNQMPRDTVWNTPGDWGFFRPLNGVPTIADVIEAESFGGEWHFVIPEQRGRLHIAWQHGKAAQGEDDARHLVRLTLTARGPIAAGSGESPILAGVDLGRETIVRAFRSLMTDEANRIWQLKS